MRGRLLLVLFGLTVGLLLAEGAARVRERFRCQSYCALYCDLNSFCGWWHASDVRGWCQLCIGGRVEWRTYGRYNRRGLRDDRDIPYEPDGSFRILVLGDSFTEAHQVDPPFTALLERRLNAAAGRGRRFEVLNAGVSNWGTDNALLYFRSEGRKYRPDLVLLAFYTGNDVMDNYRQVLAPPWGVRADKPYFELRAGRLVLRHIPLPAEPRRDRVIRRLQHFLVARSALYRLLPSRPPSRRGVARAAPAPARALPGQIFLTETPEPYRVAWRITRGLVLALRAAVEAHGGRFAVVIVNSREEVCEGWRWTLTMQPAFRDSPHDFDKPNRLIIQFLRRKGIPAIPLLDAFRAEFGETEAGFFGLDYHWTPAGHELASQVIARALRAQGLVPLSPGPD